jgi:two-component system, chemotaxis family, CheB/CheR fusion protein
MPSKRRPSKQSKSARQRSEATKTSPRVQQAPRQKKSRAKKKHSDQEDLGCPIVGIGGSAGGFEATMELLKHVPPKCGTAFAIVQHLDPRHASRLATLLGRVTTMPVSEVTGTLVPKPDTVYVQPASKCLICKDGSFVLERRTEVRNVAIDHFFESLAECRGSRAIGVVLSGTGSDGTAGLRAIKAAGGLTFAQDPQTAKFDAMPNSAIRAGFVDGVLSPREIAQEVGRIAEHPYWRHPFSDAAEAQELSYDEADDLGRIFLSLKKFTGVDFSSYKHSTLNRRIQRRMAVHRIERLGQYARFLRDNKKEAESLFSDLLINVTRFFRDKSVFTALQKKFLPAILKKKDRHAELRVWVPGCASGEEVYSMAICILEALGKRAGTVPVQIFGTDLSEFAIEHARAGIYSATIAKDVSSARLKRFFTKRDSTYQIARPVRDLCTFARQNIAADAPFSRLDLISCRNVLIYLGPELHKRCLPHFHYALRPGGLLILGPAESVGTFEELFQLVDRKNKIYAKKNVPTPQSALGLFLTRTSDGLVIAKPPALDSSATRQLRQTADRIMLSVYAPAAVVVDSEMEVQQFRGRPDSYLAHAPGKASLNIFQIVQPSLAPDLRAAIHRAQKTKKPVRKERALVKAEGKMREINIQVVPFKIAESNRFWFLVIFDETTRAIRPGVLPRILGRTATQREVGELRQQLAASKESLQIIIEEQEATNEELKSANEEIESSNEELQSSNEELETAKEELQSTNEELTTLNEELSNRNLETMQLNSDLSNLLASIQLPIVTVDSALKVRRVTPAARNAFNILQSDIGRPISDFKPNIGVHNLEQMLREVIDTLTMQEKKVRDGDGRSFLLRIRPYRSGDNKIDGAVLTLVDLSEKSPNDRGKKR